MIDFDKVPCSICGRNQKEVKEMKDNSITWFWVECKLCGHKTQLFRYVLTSQANWIVEYQERNFR